ncbi:hypothetical protein [Campylobacter iguaniorum]|uniref:hypothetical protein n=1 Tax=Campylobacter iguaniorum TaxID=1244531 RepID=UPI0007C96A8D|nr:hypothetical protein [Campylobacter iguaniorum]
MKTEPIANLTPKAKENFMAFLKTTDLPVRYSDPEFISNYINFAFDESLEKSGMKKYKSTFAPDMAHFADFLSANCFGD